VYVVFVSPSRQVPG